jgi:hypothetical protein
MKLLVRRERERVAVPVAVHPLVEIFGDTVGAPRAVQLGSSSKSTCQIRRGPPVRASGRVSWAWAKCAVGRLMDEVRLVSAPTNTADFGSFTVTRPGVSV